MYYVIGQNVYAPHEGHDFDERATDTIEDDVWDLYCQDRSYFKIENGKFVALKPQEELKADIIRETREKECFPIINRGSLWYNKLTEQQKAELSTWYEAWLDAPATNVIPNKPSWLV